MFRFSTRKRSVSSAENEEKGRGERVKRKPAVSEEENTSESSSEDYPTIAKPLTGKKKLLAEVVILPFPTFTHTDNHLQRPLSPKHPSLKVLFLHHQISRKEQLPNKRCSQYNLPLYGTEVHQCSFQKGAVSLKGIPQAECQISSKVIFLSNVSN